MASYRLAEPILAQPVGQIRLTANSQLAQEEIASRAAIAAFALYRRKPAFIHMSAVRGQPEWLTRGQIDVNDP
jgi:hypothetical protein